MLQKIGLAFVFICLCYNTYLLRTLLVETRDLGTRLGDLESRLSDLETRSAQSIVPIKNIEEPSANRQVVVQELPAHKTGKLVKRKMANGKYEYVEEDPDSKLDKNSNGKSVQVMNKKSPVSGIR